MGSKKGKFEAGYDNKRGEAITTMGTGMMGCNHIIFD